MRRNKGITLLTLVITIIVMLIIAGALITVGVGNLKTKNLVSMYTDLKSINDKIAVYYNKYGRLPLKEKFMGAYDFKVDANPNDDEDGYYIVDVKKLDKLVLTKQLEWEENDVYIINTKTHTLYYPEGIELEGERYYRLPGEYSKLEIYSELELEISANTRELTRMLTISITGSASSGVKKVVLPNGESKTYSTETKVIKENYVISKNGTYEVTIMNNNGKSESKKITINNILESDIEIASSPTGMTNGEVTVTIIWPTEVGIKEVQIGDGEWKTVTGKTSQVEVTENTTVRARLSNGEIELSSTQLIVNNIDKIAPTVPAIVGGSTSYATSQTISVSKVSTDDESNIAYYEYYLTSNSTLPTKEIIATGKVGETAIETSKTFNTDYAGDYIYYRAVDNVGNKSAWSNSQRLYIDTKPPIVTAKNSSVTIYKGASNSTSSYFTVSENGNASITGTTYNIENTSSLASGTYTIKCTITSPKNNVATASKTDVKVTTLKETTVENLAGTSVQAVPVTYG